MAKVEIGLGTVVGDVHFAVLIRTHRARIDVEIRIELPDPDAIAARLQESGERTPPSDPCRARRPRRR